MAKATTGLTEGEWRLLLEARRDEGYEAARDLLTGLARRRGRLPRVSELAALRRGA